MSARTALHVEQGRQLEEEMGTMRHGPLLPSEKTLIATSLGVGVVLLLVFIWMSQTLFPGVPH